MLNKKYSHTNNMLGNDIYLRKLVKSDLNMLHKNCFSNENVTKCVGWNYSKSIDDTKRILHKLLNDYNEKFCYTWGIETIKNKELIGIIFAVEIDKKNMQCELRCCLGKNWWSKGYATTCVQYVMNYLFNYACFNEIVCKVQSRNIASIKIVEKCGMKYKTKEDHYIKKINEENDCILVYSMLKGDFIPFNINKYTYDKPNFEQCKNFYVTNFIKYNPKINEINNDLVEIISKSITKNSTIDTYCNILKNRKDELFSLISELVNFFGQLKENKMTVYLNGSYSRNSQSIYSDIDLNFMYPNKNIEKYLPIEDIIAFMLSNIFNIKYRDRIHPMGYLILTNNKELTKSKYYSVVFNSGDMIISTCRNNCYDIMYENINMPRSSTDISSYIESENRINCLKEFVYNYEIVYSNTDDKIRNKLKKTDKKIINNKAYEYYIHLLIEKLIDDIIYQKESLKKNLIYVKDFKKTYKTNISNVVYSLFALERRLELKKSNNLDIELINIDMGFEKFENVGIPKNMIKKFKKAYYKYIFELNKIEHVFYKLNTSLSSHTDEKMDRIINGFKDIYGYNIYMNLSMCLNLLYDTIIDILIILKDLENGC